MSRQRGYVKLLLQGSSYAPASFQPIAAESKFLSLCWESWYTMIQVALIGYGYWGPKLASCVIASGDRAQLAVICEQSPERAASARASHPRVAVRHGIESVFADPAIDAVIVATPTSTHYPIARRALKSGKNVLVEKPLAYSFTDATALTDMSQRSGLVLMVDHTYLFSPPLQSIQRLVIDRDLGPLRYYQSIRSNCVGPSHEISVLWDLAVHDLAILDALMASVPDSIQAAGLGNSHGAPVSHARLMLSYPDHAFASVLVSWIAPSKVRSILLGFEHHTIVWDDLMAESCVQLFDRGVEAMSQPSTRRLHRTAVENIPVSGAEPLANVVQHFLDCITHGTAPRSSGSSATAAVRLLEAADLSLARGSGATAVDLVSIAR